MTYCADLDQELVSLNKALTKSALLSLFSGKTLAITVDSFKSYQNFNEINQEILQCKTSSYTYDGSVVSHVGVSSYGIDDDPKQFEKYYQNVDTSIAQLQSIFKPSLDPIKIFKAALESIWDHGVAYINLHDKKTFSGIIRIIHGGSMIHAHQDFLSWSNPGAKNTDLIIAQCGMNYFTQVPNEGGCLIMWKKSLSREEFFKASKGDFCIHLDNMPNPDISIKPKQGMLALINANYLHAIQMPIDKDRIAVSCFVGYQGDKQPLLLWS
jgi:hypothetical protein